MPLRFWVKGESVKGVGSITSNFLCNKSWRINTGNMDDTMSHSCVYALSFTAGCCRVITTPGGHSHMEVTGMCEHDPKSRGFR